MEALRKAKFKLSVLQEASGVIKPLPPTFLPWSSSLSSSLSVSLKEVRLH